ncbi:MAG: hypothetical protein JOZ63_03950, partial [Planctomycetaceae bacterium]|nr:hypothetical protein [Planctomycetaceae bacterium]
MVIQSLLTRRTRGHRDMHDLTDEVDQLVVKSGVTTGIASLFVVGSTAA